MEDPNKLAESLVLGEESLDEGSSYYRDIHNENKGLKETFKVRVTANMISSLDGKKHIAIGEEETALIQTIRSLNARWVPGSAEARFGIETIPEVLKHKGELFILVDPTIFHKLAS